MAMPGLGFGVALLPGPYSRDLIGHRGSMHKPNTAYLEPETRKLSPKP